MHTTPPGPFIERLFTKTERNSTLNPDHSNCYGVRMTITMWSTLPGWNWSWSVIIDWFNSFHSTQSSSWKQQQSLPIHLNETYNMAWDVYLHCKVGPCPSMILSDDLLKCHSIWKIYLLTHSLFFLCNQHQTQVCFCLHSQYSTFPSRHATKVMNPVHDVTSYVKDIQVLAELIGWIFCDVIVAGNDRESKNPSTR